MTVDSLIQQQAARNSSTTSSSSAQKPDDPEENALFTVYHLNGYLKGPGFIIESY